MFGALHGLSHFLRHRQLRHDLDMKAPLPGSSSTPTSLCTWLMGAGAILFVVGFFVAIKALLLLGVTLVVAGLLMAVASSLMDAFWG